MGFLLGLAKVIGYILLYGLVISFFLFLIGLVLMVLVLSVCVGSIVSGAVGTVSIMKNCFVSVRDNISKKGIRAISCVVICSPLLTIIGLITSLIIIATTGII